jgi:hypothetical protein
MVKTIDDKDYSAFGRGEDVKPLIEELYRVRSVRSRELDVREAVLQTNTDGSYERVVTESLVRKASISGNEAVVAKLHIWTIGKVHRERRGLAATWFALDQDEPTVQYLDRGIKLFEQSRSRDQDAAVNGKVMADPVHETVVYAEGSPNIISVHFHGLNRPSHDIIEQLGVVALLDAQLHQAASHSINHRVAVRHPESKAETLQEVGEFVLVLECGGAQQAHKDRLVLCKAREALKTCGLCLEPGLMQFSDELGEALVKAAARLPVGPRSPSGDEDDLFPSRLSNDVTIPTSELREKGCGVIFCGREIV